MTPILLHTKNSEALTFPCLWGQVPIYTPGLRDAIQIRYFAVCLRTLENRITYFHSRERENIAGSKSSSLPLDYSLLIRVHTL